MANHLSALKRTRQLKKRTLVNRQNTTRLRHQIRAFRRALQSNDVNAVTTLYPATVSVIDWAARKGIIKRNTAARYKSRLTLRVNALQAKPAA